MSNPILKESKGKSKLEFLITESCKQIRMSILELHNQGIECSFPEEIEFTVDNISFTIKIQDFLKDFLEKEENK